MGWFDRTTFSALVLVCVCAACSSTVSGNAPVTQQPTQCNTDTDCATTSTCQEWHCVVHQCQSMNLPDGTNAPNAPAGLVCQRAVCNGTGGLRTVADPTNVPQGQASACKRYSCDASGNPSMTPDPANPPPDTPHDCAKESCDPNGNVVLAPDPTDAPIDMPHDCKKDVCGADGGIAQTPDPTDTPVDVSGDCKKDVCNADGTVGQVPDNMDAPPPSTCFSFTCNNGMANGTPINATMKCDPLGFVCGTDGLCSTCPVPDAACDESGPGSRSSTTAYDFQGIGHCDDGGRYFCGTVPAGQTDYYMYYDDGTGPLCVFDPYFEISPQAPVTMCAYFNCPSISCPAGATSSTSAAGQPGCCLTAQPGTFTGMPIGFCNGGRVTLQVTTSVACTGYELHFHD
jgi:hypothetical protein